MSAGHSSKLFLKVPRVILKKQSVYAVACSRDFLRFARKVKGNSTNFHSYISKQVTKIEDSTVAFSIPNCKWGQPTAQMSSKDKINIQAVKGWDQSAVSDTYEKTRPDYNPLSVEFLLQKLGALGHHSEKFTIVELGAGTGKFTRPVQRILDQHGVKNAKIVSTEPVREMCRKFREMVPDVEILQCPASDLGLPGNSADAIVAAQCFHWFSDAESVREIHRVLKPQGMLGIIWNLPDRSLPWVRAIEEILDVKYRLHKIARPETKEWLRQLNNHGGFGPLSENDSHTYSTEHSFDGLIERFKGISVVAAAEGEEKEKMLERIGNEIRSAHDAEDNLVYTYPYVVEIKWFQKL